MWSKDKKQVRQTIV
jgi:hypothetical protein